MKNIFLIVSFFFIVNGSIAQSGYKLDGREIKIEKPVLFKTGTAVLQPEAEEALTIIKQYLEDKSYISLLRIECHTDDVGNSETNQQLSEQRALAICKKLREMGADCKRLVAVGFGSNKPVADNSTMEGRSQNRRISFVNVAIKGKLIDGMPEDGGGKIAGDPCEQN